MPLTRVLPEQRVPAMKTPFTSMDLEDEAYIAEWENYLNKSTVWELLKWIVYSIENVNEKLKCVTSAYERIKRIAPHVWHELSEPDKICMLLNKIVHASFEDISERKKKEILLWVRKQCAEPMEQKHFWSALKCEIEDEFEAYEDIYPNTERITSYVLAWKKCFKQKLYVDMADSFQELIANGFIKTCATDVIWQMNANTLMKMLQTFDYFYNFRESCLVTFMEKILSQEDKELLLAALRKNLVSTQGANVGIYYIRENEKYYDQMPLLIMKLHGEWQEVQSGEEDYTY